MPESPVVRVDTLDDLKKILFIQRKITRMAQDELEAVASDNLLGAAPEEKQVRRFMKEEAELLASYALRPTLSEWNKQGGMESAEFYGGSQTWGASFAVAILTGELVLEQVKAMHPGVAPAVKGIFIALLTAEVQAAATSMDSEELGTAVMKFNLTKADGSPLDEESKEKFRATLAETVQTLIGTGLEYGLFEQRDAEAHVITEVGIRVHLHMQDIHKFVNVMADAHAKFQNQKPLLMSTLSNPPEKPRRRVSKSRKHGS